MTKSEIQQYVYDFLYKKGVPHITICAIMGNITGESGWNPDSIEHGSGIGFGLCQWSFSRRETLEGYGTTLQHQCEFLWTELTGENKNITGASYQWISNPADSVDGGEGFSFSNSDFMSGNGNLATLTKAFCYCWERPAYATNHLDSTRIPSAESFYNSMSYSGSGGGETPDPEPEEPDIPDEPEEPEEITTIKKKKFNFILFSQRRRLNQWKNRIF